MELILQIIAVVVTVASFVGGIVGWIIKQGITNPLTNAINALQKTIIKFEKALDILERNQHDIDKRLVIVEQSSKSAHHRIDRLEEERV